MNAKKIMGAVLVALLAAALFIGAGAAAVTDGQTVFVNQKVPGLTGTWTSGTNSITAQAEGEFGYFTGSIVEGVYVNGTSDNAISITVKYPTAVVSSVAGVSGNAATSYEIIGNTYYIGSGIQTFSVSSAADGVDIEAIYLTLPNGNDEVITSINGNANAFKGKLLNAGEYVISVVFDIDDFATGTLASEVEAKPVTFKVAEAGDVTISASVDQIIRTDNFKVTIVGQPGVTFQVSYDKDAFNFNSNQKGLLYASVTPNTENDGFQFVMPNTGKVEFVIAGSNDAEDSEKITVEQISPGLTAGEKNKESVTVKFLKGTITAEADAASYFVGDVVTITGTNTAGTIAGYIIKGTNFEYSTTLGAGAFEEGDASSETFEFEIDTSVIDDDDKKLDVGTYTITIYIGQADKPTAKATVAVVLKQPFISIVDAPEVIVQDTKVEFVINAEAVKVNGEANPYITYYLFGTNFFDTGKGEQDEDVETNYIVTLEKDYTENMSAGQYFAVFQHPMYDGVFNVTGNADTWWISVNDAKTINVKERQTANAAQALCDALDIQSIDDMYVKYSFFVVGEDESFTISEIPATIAQGETLTISGVSTANAGEYVTVEMISTAFAAVPKETVGSAAFIAVTTQIADDGTWEVTFDTSNLNVDEYSLSVACTGEDKPWKNVEINVVEAADEPVTPPTDEPGQDEPGQDEPVAPETPGFGALAALAGLGAVAVLLLRRE